MKQTDKVDLKKGAWSPEEDQKLIAYIRKYGIWNWSQMPKAAGLSRSGKSCRLRWLNYLQPDLKRGRLTMEEIETIIELHKSLGNKWSQIAAQLPGRTDNEIKNFWHTHTKKRRRILRQRNAFKAKKTKHDEKNIVAEEDTSFRYVAAEIYSESSITVAESTEFPIAESYSQSKDSCVTIEAMGSTESICSSESRGEVQETLFPEQFWMEDVCIQLVKKQADPRSDRQLGFPISDINATIFEEPGRAHLVHEFEPQGSTYFSSNNELTSFWFGIFMEATRL